MNDEIISWLEKQVLIQQIKPKIESTVERISAWQKGAEENFQCADLLYQDPKNPLEILGIQVTINWYLKSLE